MKDICGSRWRTMYPWALRTLRSSSARRHISRKSTLILGTAAGAWEHKLVLQVCDWAAGNGYASVTLTTFRDVPWNMPFYERLGFRVIPLSRTLARAPRRRPATKPGEASIRCGGWS